MYTYTENWNKSEILDVFDAFVYRKNFACPDGIVITRYEGDETRLSIPGEIDGKPVVGIGREVFSGAQLTEVFIPEGVRRIGADAFSEQKLVSVHLPESLEYIDAGAFSDCPLSEHIDFPKKLKKIGRGAFSGCSLKEALLPDGLTVLGPGAFRECAKLRRLRLPDGIESFADTEAENGDPFLEESDFGALESDFTGAYMVETFRLCSSLEQIIFDYPADMERTEGKRPLSRAAMCQMFGETPWLQKALEEYRATKLCAEFNAIPCPAHELFELRETPEAIILTGMKRRLNLDYYGCTIPKEFSGKRIMADNTVFSLEEHTDGSFLIRLVKR